MIDNLKGHMIDNYVYILIESVLRGYHEYKHNWSEGSNFASASAKGQRYFKIDIFAPKFTPQVSALTCANFLSRSWEFYKKLVE